MIIYPGYQGFIYQLISYFVLPLREFERSERRENKPSGTQGGENQTFFPDKFGD